MQDILEVPLKQWHQNSAHISYGGLDWLVHYDFSPAERQGWLNPGAPAEVQITEVLALNGRDPVNLRPFIDEGILLEMEEIVLQQLREY